MTTPKPPGLHPLAWRWLVTEADVMQTAACDDETRKQAALSTIDAWDRWYAEGCPLLDDGIYADSQTASRGALLAEIARLNREAQAEVDGRVAWCRECGRVSSCDEDRCCSMCGYDLIVLADLHSAEVLEALWEEERTAVQEGSSPDPARVATSRGPGDGPDTGHPSDDEGEPPQADAAQMIVDGLARVTRERDEARAEVERLKAALEAQDADAADHHSDCYLHHPGCAIREVRRLSRERRRLRAHARKLELHLAGLADEVIEPVGADDAPQILARGALRYLDAADLLPEVDDG
jgi:hypothetical protein